MFNEFLESDYGVDNSPRDNTRITQIILYFDEPDARELKRLAKEKMKEIWPETYDKEANLSDLFLYLLKNDTQHGNSEETNSASAFI